MSIRLVTPGDGTSLLSLNSTCFPEDSKDRTVNARLLKVISKNPCWVFDDGDIKACILSEISNGYPYIWSLATHPSQRGKGLATTLLQVFEKHYAAQGYSRFWLHTRVDNPAQKLYFDNGYRVASFERNIYGPNEHGIIMRKRVD